MAHPRQLIREAARAALVDQTAAGSRVYETRVIPWRQAELPAVAIYTLEEEVDPESAATAPRELARTVDLVIEGVLKGGAGNLDDELDDIALEIERAMNADPYLSSTASDVILSSTELEIGEESNRLLGVARLTYSVRYYTHVPDQDVTLDDFRRADVRTSLGGYVHEDDQAHDRIVLAEDPPAPEPEPEPDPEPEEDP